MLYFFTAFLILIVFLFLQRNHRSSVKYLLGTALVYLLALIFMILYLSKDIRYYNIISNYFLLPKSVWKTFMFFPISKSMILRFMNLFSVLTLLLGCFFSMSYFNHGSRRFLKRIQLALAAVLFAEYLLYDPAVEKQLYLILYPTVLDSGQYALFLRATHTATLILNHVLVFLSIASLFRASREIYLFPHLKYCIYGETLSYTLVMISWLVLFRHLPDHMLRFSKVSGYTSYASLTLHQHQVLYTIFPFYLLLSALLMCICAIALARFGQKLSQEDFTLSGQIDAVNTSFKTFCHYMKNELLAIDAEAQLLEIPQENQEDLNHIIERCQNLYDRLDKLHRSTNLSRLTMENTDLEALLRQMLGQMSPELKEYQIRIQTDEQIPGVLADACYFEQALHNIVTNALDAMKYMPKERKTLTFTLRAIDNWVSLSITDTGAGIPPEDLPHIFEPLFTSQPIAKHWGIGMTMTYQIVKAHQGKITVESVVDQGTTVRILLPNLQKMLL